MNFKIALIERLNEGEYERPNVRVRVRVAPRGEEGRQSASTLKQHRQEGQLPVANWDSG